MTLFEEVVEASRLNKLIAPYAIRRLLVRGQVVRPQEVTAGELESALPELERGLAAYLDADELELAVSAIRKLASSP